MTRHDLLVRGARLAWLPGAPVGDLAAAGGVVTEIGPEVGGDAAEVIDGTGLDLLPGGVDPHVHLNEPGRTEWEGIATGTAALAVGGVTCAIDMPLNASPPVLDGRSFDLKAAAIPGVARTDLALWGGLVPGDSTGSTSSRTAASSASRRSCPTAASTTSRPSTTSRCTRGCCGPRRSGCPSRCTPRATR